MTRRQGTGRYWLWAGAGLLVLAGVGLIAGRQMLPGAVERALTHALWAEGLDGAQVTVGRVGFSGAQGELLLDTRCAPGCTARFSVSYSLSGLWARRLDQISLSGLRLEGGLPWPQGPESRGERWQVPRIDLADTRLVLPVNPILPLELIVPAAALLPAGEGWHLQGTGSLLSGERPLAQLEIGLELTPDTPADLMLKAAPLADGPAFQGSAQLRLRSGALPEGTGQVRAEGLTFQGLAPLRVALDWQAPAGGALMLRAELELPTGEGAQGPLRGGRVELSLAGTPAQLTGELRGDGIGIGAGPRDNRFALPLSFAKGADGWQIASTAGGEMVLPALDIRGDGLSLAAPAPDAALLVAAERLLLGGTLPLLTPLRPELRLNRAEGGAGWQMLLTAPDLQGRPLLSGAALWRGEQDYALDIELPPLRLGGDGRPLPSLSPWLARWIGEVEGCVGLHLSMARDAKGATGSARLLLDGVGLGWAGGRLDGLSGVLWLDSLSPLMAPAQPLWLGGLRAGGLALQGGWVEVELPGDGSFLTGPMGLFWAGLPVMAAAGRFALGAPPSPLSLTLAPTALGRVLEALGAAGMAGEGQVAGNFTLPLTVAAGETTGLRAVGPGRLAYAGPMPPPFLERQRNDNLALVTQALRDYRFRRLEIGLTPEGAVLRTEGSSPALYGGYALGLTLRLPSPLPVPPAPPPADVAAAIRNYVNPP